MKAFSVAILICLCGSVYAQASYKNLNPLLAKEPEVATFLMGRLGHPLGTYLRIEGVRKEDGKVGNQTLIVDTINGKKITEPVGIWIHNIVRTGLPKGIRCVLNGYETGKMIGLPRIVAEAENMDEPQAGWQFYIYFIVTSIVEPSSLEIDKDKSPYRQ